MSCPMVSNGNLQEHGRLPEEVLLDPHPVENSISYIMSSGLLWKELIPTPTTHPWRGFCSPCRQISCLKITREVCAGSFRLRLRLGQDRQSWDWVSRKKSCDQCTNTSRSLTSGTILQGVKAKHFLTFFDCMCMWSFDYPSWIIIREAGISIWHQQLNQWEEVFIKQSKQIFGIMLLPIVSLPHLWSQQTKFGSFHRRRSWARSQQDKFGRLRWRSSMPSKRFPPKSTHHANDLLHAASSILGHKRKFLMLCPSTRSTSMLSKLMSLTWTSCGVVPLAKVPVQDLIKSGSGALLYPAGQIVSSFVFWSTRRMQWQTSGPSWDSWLSSPSQFATQNYHSHWWLESDHSDCATIEARERLGRRRSLAWDCQP